jgi:hypothetical protein
MTRRVQHAHKLVARVAKEAAHELYEVSMGDNVLRAEWKRQNPGATEKQLIDRFVKRNWGKCLAFARATLARLLTQPIDERLKEEIMEALVLDQSLRLGREQIQIGKLPTVH